MDGAGKVTMLVPGHGVETVPLSILVRAPSLEERLSDFVERMDAAATVGLRSEDGSTIVPRDLFNSIWGLFTCAKSPDGSGRSRPLGVDVDPEGADPADWWKR